MARKPPQEPPPPETLAEEPDTAVEPKGTVYDRLTPRLRRGMGHLPGRWDGAPSLRPLVGAPRGLPFHARDLEQWVARDSNSGIRDQGPTSECVGEASARILHVTLQNQLGAALTVPFPGRRYIYTGAREVGAYTPSVPLADVGTRPDLAFTFLGLRGIIPDTAFPFTADPVKINERLSAEQLVPANQFKMTGYYRIDSTGSTLVDDSKNALAKFHPFAMALQVDAAFEDYDGSKDITVPEGKIFGGHYIAIVGYEGDRFRGVNSWGPGWGDGGCFWITADAVMYATDHTVATAVPTFAPPAEEP